MKEVLHQIREQFRQDLNEVRTSDDLEQVKVRFFGKKGPIQQLMRSLRDVAPEERPHVGQMINQLKEDLQQQTEEQEAFLHEREQTEQLLRETLDVSLPGHGSFLGRKHLLTQFLDEIFDVLISMGFTVQTGPDVDNEYYNFSSLNLPEDHPARDMQDTFYLSNHLLLRTHTSNNQVRVMEQAKPPIRVICPGKAYRNENISARSHVLFHQIEAFYVDRHVTFGDLLETLDTFFKKLFYEEIETLYRPSYFPFVEPGLEADVRCLICRGKGCAVCKHTGWLEVAGAGMIHPQVMRNSGIDPEEYTGFAWGMGVERLAMIRYGVQDIRLFMENDQRLLRQFPAV